MIDYEKAYRMIQLIRTFERTIEDGFSKGLMRGTTHGCIGQEANAVAAMSCVRKNDFVFGTHRCHGQFIAYSNRVDLLAAEMMGKISGTVLGAGGSQHLRYKNFYTNGITGGMTPIAVGTAFSLKRENKGLVVIFLGDGGFNEGYVQESLNLAQVFQVPIVFIMEDNHYAMSTQSGPFTQESISKRVQSFGMHYVSSFKRTYRDLNHDIMDSFTFVREKQVPSFCHIDTYRFCGHSKSDNMRYMPPEERKKYIESDIFLDVKSHVKEDVQQKILLETQEEVDKAFKKAETSGEMTIDEYLHQSKEGLEK